MQLEKAAKANGVAARWAAQVRVVAQPAQVDGKTKGVGVASVSAVAAQRKVERNQS